MIHLNLTKEIINILKDVSELIVEKFLLINSLPNDYKYSIHRHVKISNIGASSRIENAVLTDIQIDSELLQLKQLIEPYFNPKSDKFSLDFDIKRQEIISIFNQFFQGRQIIPADYGSIEYNKITRVFILNLAK